MLPHTPKLSTQFVNKCFAMSRNVWPPFLHDEPVALARPMAGQRAWYQAQGRWVNVHAQLAVFSYISWQDICLAPITAQDLWEGEALEDGGYVTTVNTVYRMVFTPDLCAPSGACEVQEWPYLSEDFERVPSYQQAAGKTPWFESYCLARGRHYGNHGLNEG